MSEAEFVPVFTVIELNKARSMAFCQGVIAALKEIEDTAYEVEKGEKRIEDLISKIETLKLQTLERITALSTQELCTELYKETECIIKDP